MNGPRSSFATAAVPSATASQKHAARKWRRQRTGRVALEARIATETFLISPPREVGRNRHPAGRDRQVGQRYQRAAISLQPMSLRSEIAEQPAAVRRLLE